MSAAALAASPQTLIRPRRRRHCPDADWMAYVEAQGGNRQYRLMKLRFRRQFIDRWPRLADWFAAPLVERVGRLRGESFHHPSYPVSFRVRTYLIYLGLRGYATFDYPWLFAPGQLPIVEPAAALGIDLGAKELVEDAIALGFDPNSARQAMHWSVSRIALHTGIFDVTAISNDHIAEAWRPSASSPNAQTSSGSTPHRSATGTAPPRTGLRTCTSCRWSSITAARSPSSPAS